MDGFDSAVGQAFGKAFGGLKAKHSLNDPHARPSREQLLLLFSASDDSCPVLPRKWTSVCWSSCRKTHLHLCNFHLVASLSKRPGTPTEAAPTDLPASSSHAGSFALPTCDPWSLHAASSSAVSKLSALSQSSLRGLQRQKQHKLHSPPLPLSLSKSLAAISHSASASASCPSPCANDTTRSGQASKCKTDCAG